MGVGRGLGLGWRPGVSSASAEQSPVVPVAVRRGVPMAGEAEPCQPRVPGCTAVLAGIAGGAVPRAEPRGRGPSPRLCRR